MVLSIIVLLFDSVVLMLLNNGGVHSPALVTALIVLFTIAYILDLSGKDKSVSYPLFTAYLLRLFLVYFDLYGRGIYGLPNSGADSDMFYYNAIEYINTGDSFRGFFVAVTGTLFKYCGISKLYAQFLIALCSVVAIYVGIKIMEELGVNKENRFGAAMILAVLPNFAILSSIFVRESLITMFVSLSVLFIIRWMLRGDEKCYLLSIAFAFCAMRFHGGVVAVLASYIAMRFFYKKQTGRFGFSYKNVIPGAIVLVAAVYMYNNSGDSFFGKVLGIDSTADIANTNAKGDSTYVQYVGNSNNPVNLIIFTIPRIVFFLFSPMPFQWRGSADIIAFCFSSMFYIVVLYRTIRYLRSNRVDNRAAVIALFFIAVCTMFVFGWGCSNTGTATRHRDKMVVLYGVLLALTSDPKIDRVRKRRKPWTIRL